ncbi:peptidoglycan/LPS O-acetylase OafA/YrhL [Saccharothrix texasensis]|uniref:Peptidoglycan/LPS O-acetylase OafA/YrhL n=1 Tax=Saccharothrix texasensis TaxID=103734 RepID=A0A3N1H2D6_9PSEU|nr:peptidoglycan/LPS O-acetylase OafA/YrhL [Saccharothrix texasensis]
MSVDRLGGESTATATGVVPATGRTVPQGRNARLPSLTGLRFVAALAVFLFHVSLPFPNITLFADQDLVADVYRVFAPAGGLGVTFFFVLSGFILTWSARGGDTTPRFWRRRAAKVVPPYLVTLVIAWAVLAPETELWKAVVNIFMLQSWVPDVSTFWALNSPGWSLSVEAFFYLMFPVLYVVARKVPGAQLKYWIGGTFASIVLTCAVTYAVIPAGDEVVGNEPTQSLDQFWFAYILPAARLFDFALGIFVARAVLLGRWRNVGVPVASALLLAGYLLSYAVPVLYSLRATMVFPAAMLIAAGAIADRDGRATWFRNRPMQFLGKISYSFYLAHWLVLLYFRSLFADTYFAPGWAVLLIAAFLVTSVLAAWVLYAVVERPLTRLWSESRREPARSGG